MGQSLQRTSLEMNKSDVLPTVVKSHIERRWSQPVPSWQEIEGYGFTLAWIRCSMVGHWNERLVWDEEIEARWMNE